MRGTISTTSKARPQCVPQPPIRDQHERAAVGPWMRVAEDVHADSILVPRLPGHELRSPATHVVGHERSTGLEDAMELQQPWNRVVGEVGEDRDGPREIEGIVRELERRGVPALGGVHGRAERRLQRVDADAVDVDTPELARVRFGKELLECPARSAPEVEHPLVLEAPIVRQQAHDGVLRLGTHLHPVVSEGLQPLGAWRGSRVVFEMGHGDLSLASGERTPRRHHVLCPQRQAAQVRLEAHRPRPWPREEHDVAALQRSQTGLAEQRRRLSRSE